MRIAVVSDTHSLLRPEVLPALVGAEHILHAGDVGDMEILDKLGTIAPVNAVRGNVDKGGAFGKLPQSDTFRLGGALIHILHNIDDLDLTPEAADIRVVIYGHSHKPSVEMRNGVLYLNPGSIGPRRFSLPVTFAWLTLGEGEPKAEIVPLHAS
jgi:putative phosphoesterase